jgi:protein-disulfide isomerase
VEKIYPKEVAIVFKHQPLPFHDNAMGAALAMQAAERQRKGWKMHDLMFENNKALTRSDFEGHAKTLGLDLTRFQRDMDDPATKKEVLDDQKIAGEVGASGTPTLFINGRVVVGAKPFEEIAPIIDEEIKKADALIAGGTPLAKIYETLSKGGR